METEKSLKIGLDFHGVINTRPSYFKDFSEYAEAHGHQIYVISGGPADKLESFLKAWGIKYTELFTIFDHYASLGEVKLYPDGQFHVDDKLWNTAKAKFCRKYNIDVHIDDSSIYGLTFTTPYCLYNEQNRTCTLPEKKTINLSCPPQEVLRQLETVLTDNGN